MESVLSTGMKFPLKIMDQIEGREIEGYHKKTSWRYAFCLTSLWFAQVHAPRGFNPHADLYDIF